jgi:outer membrane immunogenic protein
MRRIALGLLAGTSILGLASIASAADMAVRKAPPPPPPPPIFSWTGFYIGAHVGAGWSTVESDLTDITVNGVSLFGLIPGPTVIPVSSHNLNGFLGGLQAGFNWQAGPIVFGAEVQASFTDIEGSTPCLLLFSCRSETDWLVTLAGRLGLAVDRALIYVKGGVAWAESEHSAALQIAGVRIDAGPVDVDRFGFVLGMGVEYAFLPNWSAKIEYNYIDFDDETVAFPITTNLGTRATIDAIADVRQSLHLIKVGVNYRFGFFGGPGPVMARY